MLAKAFKRAQALGAHENCVPLQADVPDRRSGEPVDMVNLPHHSLTHVVDAEDRTRLFTMAFQSLRPNDRFISTQDASAAHGDWAASDSAAHDIFRFTDLGSVPPDDARASLLPRTIIGPTTESTNVNGIFCHGDGALHCAAWPFTFAWITAQKLQTISGELGFTPVSMSGKFERMVAPSEQQVGIFERREASARTVC